MVLEKQFGSPTIRQAFDMLYGMEIRDHVQFGGKFYSLPGLDACFQELKSVNAPADRVNLVFWGGPPGQEDWVKGTLRTFLLDQIFRLEADNETFDTLIDLHNELRPMGPRARKLRAV